MDEDKINFALLCISQWQRRKYCIQIKKRLWALKLIAIKSKTIFYSINIYENFTTKRHQKAKRSMRTKIKNSRVLKKEVRYRFTMRPLFNSAIVLLTNTFVFNLFYWIVLFFLFYLFALFISFFFTCACLRWSEATPTCIKTSTRLNAINLFLTKYFK